MQTTERARLAYYAVIVGLCCASIALFTGVFLRGTWWWPVVFALALVAVPVFLNRKESDAFRWMFAGVIDVQAVFFALFATLAAVVVLLVVGGGFIPQAIELGVATGAFAAVKVLVRHGRRTHQALGAALMLEGAGVCALLFYANALK